MPANTTELEKRLWGAADELRANSKLKSSEYSTLNEKGRAGFVMANSAGDARGSELEIRKQMLEDRAVDVMISVGPNFFDTRASGFDQRDRCRSTFLQPRNRQY
jgi:hypothetical protein